MNNYIKKTLCIFLSFLIVMLSMSCSSQISDASNDKITIVCTIFPIYDWVSNITKDSQGIEVKLLIQDGTDMHSYQPDIKAVSELVKSDVVIYVGGESDEWLIETLANNENPDRKIISLLDIASDYIYEEEIVEGMRTSEKEGEDLDKEPEYDEHIWLSIKAAEIIVDRLSKELCKLDSTEKTLIEENTSDYIKSLHNIDEQYQAITDEANNKVMIVADRFPYRYLCEDYGIEYYAAFPGCSSDCNADFDTIIFLGNKANEYKVSAVVLTENNTSDISSGIIDVAGHDLKVVVIDSMQTVTLKEMNSGTTYLSICEDNLKALNEILE